MKINKLQNNLTRKSSARKGIHTLEDLTRDLNFNPSKIRAYLKHARTI